MARYTEHDAEIIELYTEYDFSLREIGAMIHWSPSFVKNRLIANGVPIKPRGGSKTGTKISLATLERTRELYESGLDATQVSEVMGCHKGTVINYLKRMDIPIRKSRHSTHCVKGHAFTPANTIRNNHQRRCRACKNAFNRRWSARRTRLKNENKQNDDKD